MRFVLVLVAGLFLAGPALAAPPFSRTNAETTRADYEKMITRERAIIALIGFNNRKAHSELASTANLASTCASDFYRESIGRDNGEAYGDAKEIFRDDSLADGADLTTAAGRKAALDYLRQALALKKKVIDLLDGYLVTAPAETTTTSSAKRCDVEKPFQVFAVPATYNGSYNDVFPHGIPRGAKNVKVSFVDEATGKAPPAEVFPGQTWNVEVRGFQPDGKFDVRVDVTGKGFGKPDANSRNWKVVVTYDCA